MDKSLPYHGLLLAKDRVLSTKFRVMPKIKLYNDNVLDLINSIYTYFARILRLWYDQPLSTLNTISRKIAGAIEYDEGRRNSCDLPPLVSSCSQSVNEETDMRAWATRPKCAIYKQWKQCHDLHT